MTLNSGLNGVGALGAAGDVDGPGVSVVNNRLAVWSGTSGTDIKDPGDATWDGSLLNVGDTGQIKAGTTRGVWLGNSGTALAFNRNPTTGTLDNSAIHAFQWQHNGNASEALDVLTLNTYLPSGALRRNALIISGRGWIGIGALDPGEDLIFDGSGISYGSNASLIHTRTKTDFAIHTIEGSLGVFVELILRGNPVDTRRIRQTLTGQVYSHLVLNDDNTIKHADPLSISLISGFVGIGTANQQQKFSIVTGATTVSGFHLGELDDTGGYLASTLDSEMAISGGWQRNGVTQYRARGTEASLIELVAGEVRFFTATGLTIGVTAAPPLRMTLSNTQLALNFTASSTLPHYSSLISNITGLGFPGGAVASIITGATEAVQWNASQNQVNAKFIGINTTEDPTSPLTVDAGNTVNRRSIDVTNVGDGTVGLRFTYAAGGSLDYFGRTGTSLLNLVINRSIINRVDNNGFDASPQAFLFEQLSANSRVTMVVRADDTQTASIFEWQTSDETVLGRFAIDGKVFIGATEIADVTPGTIGGFPAGQLMVRNTGTLANDNSVITGHNSFNGNTQLWYLGSGSSSNQDIVFLNRQNASLSLGTNSTVAIAIEQDQTVSFSNDVTVAGNLVVDGTTTQLSSETVNLADNHMYLNAGYTTAVAQTGGIITNFLPTATVDTVVTGAFVAGVPATNNPTVATVGAATFAIGAIIQFSNSNGNENDGVFEVLSHAANLLTIRGIGLTSTVEDWTGNQFVANASDSATITQVNVSVMRAGTDGAWETASGLTTGFTFSDLVTTASGVDGAIQFATSGGFSSDDANLHWNDVENSLSLGTNAPRTSAILQTDSTTKGTLEARWTGAQETTNVAALAVADEGLTWFNTTTKQFMGWNGTAAVIRG